MLRGAADHGGGEGRRPPAGCCVKFKCRADMHHTYAVLLWHCCFWGAVRVTAIVARM